VAKVEARVHVPASPEEVWEVLSDINGWQDWNDVMVEGRCDGGQNARVSVKVDTGLIVFPVKSRMIIWTPHEALAWGERVGPLIQVEHGFTLTPDGDGTRVLHYESFSGPIGWALVTAIGTSLTQRYQDFLDALAARVTRGA
jgi:hypothetical protein